jgi:adenosylcobyric acid synthase
MKYRPLMIQGCTSDAGKSLITTALCRWYSSQGIKVAPFKAQNMSNNARVVSGGEIGVAQWLQAKAARVEPDVRMNPILLKPQSDTFSQVITLGKSDLELTKSPWQGRSQKLWPIARQALHELVEEYELVIIEGAGSPAEINLKPDDYINMRVAKEVGASVLLTVDIDRGGAFAHLLGTWNLLDLDERELIDGFILNKFRGDASLLAPAPDMIKALTGIRTRAVVPYLDHRLPSEEGPSVNLISSSQGPLVYIICGPYSSNLDEFHLLQSSGRVTFINAWRDLIDADLIILPGSKNSGADANWLQETGLAKEIRRANDLGIRILGICGGLQILGHKIVDPFQIEGGGFGLGLLNITTVLNQNKLVTKQAASLETDGKQWSWCNSKNLSVYEIRFGSTSAAPEVRVNDENTSFEFQNILGIYFHGLFENPEIVLSFTGIAPSSLESSLDDLASSVSNSFNDNYLLDRLA